VKYVNGTGEGQNRGPEEARGTVRLKADGDRLVTSSAHQRMSKGSLYHYQ
jgi:hypothetical protein